MLLIVSLMFAGILIGYLVVSRSKSDKPIKIFGKVQQIATMLQLFVMGLWFGGNPEFWRDFKSTGFYGLLFSLVTIGGSVLFVFLASKLFKREEKR